MIKLNFRLILIFLTISVIPLFLISYLALYQASKITTEGTLRQLDQVASVNKGKLKQVIEENKRVIASVVTESESSQSASLKLGGNKVLPGADLKEVLENKALNVSGVESVSIYDSSGKNVSSSEGGSDGIGKNLTALFPKVQKEGVFQDFILDDSGSLKLIALKRLSSDESAQLYVAVVRRGEDILALFEDPVGIGNSFEFILATRDRDGNALHVTPSRFDQAGPLRKTTPVGDFTQSITRALSGKEGIMEDTVDWRGREVLASSRYIDETGWGITAKKDIDETHLPIIKLRNLLVVVGLVAVVIIVLISLSSATSIVAPINRLIKITSRISGGDLSQRTLVESKDEIGLLELAFNEMAAKLKESYESLEKKVLERTAELEASRRNLEMANENLRELDKLKDEFVSVASHELRTPMTAISGMISMIFEGDYGPINKSLNEPLKDISKSTQRLIILVNDILNVSRIETGKLKLSLSTFDIRSVIGEMVEQLMPIAIEKGISFGIEGSGSVVVQADKDKTKEILNNLIGNALKFTQDGSALVYYKADEDEVKVFIKDTGIGISRDDQLKLFGKFKQISSQQIGKPAGSGLGLYISRELTRKMGGELWIDDSNLGKGSIFAFSLPKAGSMMAELIERKLKREPQAGGEALQASIKA